MRYKGGSNRGVGGGVNSLAWVAADELASCGADAMVKTWKV